jgi:tetratricopeptide (TPR) repeat protein
MRIWPFIISLTILAPLAPACRPGIGANLNTVNHHPNVLNKRLWELARDTSIKAEAASDKQEKANLALQGISYAEECIMKEPETAECYYYRAINTGIYYSAHVVGYQDGLKGMIKDCEKVIALNDKVDHGGAYRTLGKIYTDVPESTVSKNGVIRDLPRAIEYLKKAVSIGPNYPENHIYLAEALLEADRTSDARASLSTAMTLTPQWKNHNDYSMWQKLNREMAKKLTK